MRKLGTELRVGALNTCGVNKAGKRELIERWANNMKVDIICLSETKAASRGVEGGKPKMIGNDEVKSSWKTYFSTGISKKDLDEKDRKRKMGTPIEPELRIKTTEQAGCAIMVHKRLWHLIRDVRPLGGRMMKMILDTRPKTIVMAIYAPHAHHEIEVKEAFYDKLRRETGKGGNSRNILLIAAGDFNARVGQPRTKEEEAVLGRHALQVDGESEMETKLEENRELFINWAMQNDLVATNTLFRHPQEETVTYRTPSTKRDINGHLEGTVAQIDYILVNNNHRKAVKQSKSDANPNLDSDDFPVILDIRCKFKKRQEKQTQQVTAYTSKQAEVSAWEMNRYFEECLQNKDVSVYETWEQIYKMYLSTLTKKNNIKEKHWISEGTWKLIQQKADEEWWWTEEERKEWAKEIRKRTRADKKAWKLEQISEDMKMKERWDGAKKLRQEYKESVYARRDKDGAEVSLDGRAEALAAYLEEIHWGQSTSATLSSGRSQEANIYQSEVEKMVDEKVRAHLQQAKEDASVSDELDSPFEEKELDACIRKMKRNKATGTDNITTDWLKDLNSDNRRRLLQMINAWWIKEVWPRKLEEARVAALYKKGDPECPENYRPLSLLNTLFKALAAMLKARIEGAVDHCIGQEQFGFRKKRGTTQAIFVARRVQEFAERAGLRAQFVFLDWEKAFDKIEHEWLMAALDSYGLPARVQRMIAQIYSNPTFYVEVEGVKSSWKTQRRGIRQGCPLSPYLFILVMNRIIEQVNILKEEITNSKTGKQFESMRIGQFATSEILFADDTMIIAKDNESLKGLLWTVELVS